MTAAAVSAELEHVRSQITKIDGAELVTCVPAQVRIHITKTEHKQMVACFQFPEDYPNQPILLELKSRHLPDKMLEKLTRICDEEARKLVRSKQIIALTKFLRKFIEDNPLCVCNEEICDIKHRLVKDTDEVKLKQKTSQVVLKLRENRYFINVYLTIPDDYPKSQIGIEVTNYNFPLNLKINFAAQAVEIARRCIQPPLRKKPKDPPFEPKPQLGPVAEYFINTIIRKYPNGDCPICKKSALPPNPEDVTNEGSDKEFVFRVYCGHLYHHGCLETYMKTPPFTGGKKCPICDIRIFHEKFKIPPELAEARWAQEEARRRELEEVVDFLK